MSEGALAGLRVLDLSRDMARFATKLLAEQGASVVKLAGRGASGRPMVDPRAAGRGGLLDWWYDGGKTKVAADVDHPSGQEAVRRLASVAELVIDDEAPNVLAQRGLDYEQLSAHNQGLVQVSLTGFGRTGPRAGWQTSDLVAAALGGVSSLTGPPDKAMNSWGRQNYNFGSFMAAISGLAGVYAARRTGVGQHVDLSLHEVVTSSLENLFFQYNFDDLLAPLPKIAPRQGSLHWAGAYKVVPARTGSVMVTPTPVPDPLFVWMMEDGFDKAAEFLGVEVLELIPRMGEIMQLMTEWAVRHDASYLFEEGQKRHIALGEVQSVEKVAANAQFEFRGFYETVNYPDGPPIRRPGHPAQMLGTPPPPLQPPTPVATAVDEVVRDWGRLERGNNASPPQMSDAKPLDGLRIVDFTWVLAGPFCTRILGDLGADILKFQTEGRATNVNKDDYPYYFVWNRSKRSVMLDQKHPRAHEVMRRIIENSDVLVENFAAGVLDRWGLDYDTVHAWNPRLVYIRMSGCGHEGPWKSVISYAPTVHALCGLTYLTNPADRRDIGPGFSLNDHAAGLAAAELILAGIEARQRTGEGQLIDMAQLEVGSYLCGPALLDFFANGRVTEPTGNADALVDHVPNETYLTADGGWLAVTARHDDDWQRLCGAIDRPDLASDERLASEDGRRENRAEIDAAVGQWVASRDADSGMVTLQEAGVPAGKVQNAADLMADEQLRARDFWREFDHPHFGVRPYDRFPAIWSRSRLEPYLRSPYFGEHSFEVYSELAGMTEEEIAIAMGEGLFQ